MQKKLNLIYTANQFFYFALFGATFAFLSVYLLNEGFSNSTIGLAFSITGLVTIVVQSALANFLDRNKEIQIQTVVSILSWLIIGMSGLLFLVSKHLLIFILVILVLSLTQTMMGLINSLAFIFEPFGLKMNYGFARGMGSFAYAIMMLLIGSFIEKTSAHLIPVFYILFAFLLWFSARNYKLPKVKDEGNQKKSSLTDLPEIDQSFIEFFKKYKRVVILMGGVVLLFFAHTLINNFLIQVITPVGGTHQTLGIAAFIAAIVEIPAMMNLKQLEKIVPLHRLIQISSAFFVAKHALTYLAPNMSIIYIAQFLQIGAFSVAFPAYVEYINSKIEIVDLVKGQSLLTGAIALSNVFSGYFGGLLLDYIGMANTLLFSVFTTILGLVVVFYAVEPVAEIKDVEGIINE